MKKITFLILITLCTSSFAKWELYGLGDDFAEYSYETTSIVKKGSTAKMWVMYSYTTPETLGDVSYLSMLNLNIFDCGQKRLKTIAAEFFSDKSAKGKVVHTLFINENQAEFVPVAPGSFGDRQVQIACGKARRMEDFWKEDKKK
jgi:hypothetical protein